MSSGGKIQISILTWIQNYKYQQKNIDTSVDKKEPQIDDEVDILYDAKSKNKLIQFTKNHQTICHREKRR